MSNRTLSLVKSRNIWIEIKRVHKAKVSVTSRSKSKTDGYLSQMVGNVSFLYTTPFCATILAKDMICCPLRYGTTPARLQGRQLYESEECTTVQRVLRQRPHSLRFYSSSHDLHRSALGRRSTRYFDHSGRMKSTCLLEDRPRRHPSHRRPGTPRELLLRQMLTYVTLLQSLAS